MRKGKKIVGVACVLLLALLAAVLVACNEDKENGADTLPSEAEYIIQYTDDDGTHTITVRAGEPYSIPAIPSRTGHNFLGLYDAERGGTQYVNAKGASIAPFSDNKNMVLFPQFEAKEYTVILEYGEAPVTGEREIVVEYGGTIESLPVELTAANKEFMGWYTEPDRGGVQVADRYGIRPDRKKLTEETFDLSNPNGYVYLYAGFRGEMHTVTFYFEVGMAPEEKEIEHGTPIASVVTDTRVDGKAAYVWSLKENDTEHSAVFNGRVEGDMVLYALEYAPVIDFNAGEGDKVTSIIAPAGSSVVLPEATRENWSFAGWYTAGGSKYTATVMPTDSVKLTAKWEPMLIFDERGGTLVEDIAAEQGTRVTLPTTEKDGYMFAGWYTEQGEEYTSTSMPAYSTKLVAKYWKVENKRYVLIEATETVGTQSTTTTPDISASSHTLDLTDLYTQGIRKIKLTAHYVVWYEWGNYNSDPSEATASMAWYSQSSASDAYKVWGYGDTFRKSTTTKKNAVYETEISLNTDKLYVCRYQSRGSGYTHANWTDFWVEVEYPDMSQLY